MRLHRFSMYVGCVIVITILVIGCQLFDNGQDSSMPTVPDSAALQSASEADGESEAENLVNIVGGRATSLARWPWIAALVYRNQNAYWGGQLCGGTLIHKYWVVTAAHCVTGKTPQSIEVVLGTVDLRSPRERIRVARIIKHPRYNPRTEDNDIALLKLAKASGQPVASYNASASLDGRRAQVAGWGNMIAQPPGGNTGGRYPSRLREVTVPIVSDAQCRRVYGNGITASMLCAGYIQGRRDSCDGDSGGPMVVNNTLVGIVSWGIGCAWRGYYGVYTNVSRYKSWINQRVR